MSKHSLINFGGRLYLITVPDNSSVEEAARIFALEVAKGNVNKLTPGALLGSIDTLLERRGHTKIRTTTSTKGLDPSRAERGTAGIGRNEVAGIVAATRQMLSYPLISNISLIVDEITVADYVIQTPVTFPVANLTNNQVQVLIASTAVNVNQSSDLFSQEKGVGRYGINGLQLELAGYLKPGVSHRFFNQQKVYDPNPDNFVDIMNSPSIWTGKDGVTSINILLSDDNLQARIQQQLLEISYAGLLRMGTIQEGGITADSIVQGLILQNAVKYGTDAATQWATDTTPPELIVQMNETGQQSLYALQLLEKQIIPDEKVISSPTAFVNTVPEIIDMNNVQQQIINDPKIGSGPG